MKIIQCSPDLDTDRMYCPSTDEVIFAPGNETLNENAAAFIAYWHGEVLSDPSITDANLASVWKEYYKKWIESDKKLSLWKTVEKFLKGYKNTEWVVLECTFHGFACGPVSTTVYHVVKADTIIEEDPDYEEQEKKELTKEEFDIEVIMRQIRPFLSKG